MGGGKNPEKALVASRNGDLL